MNNSPMVLPLSLGPPIIKCDNSRCQFLYIGYVVELATTIIHKLSVVVLWQSDYTHSNLIVNITGAMRSYHFWTAEAMSVGL